MNTRHLGTSILILGVGALSLSSACGQPKPKCTTGRGAFAAVYTTTSTDPVCTALKGEQLGLQSYNEPQPNGAPNLDKVPIAIQSVDMATARDAAIKRNPGGIDAADQVYTLAEFTTPEPDDDDFCYAAVQSAAQTSTPLLPGIAADPADPTSTATPEVAATVTRYDWSALKFYVTPYATGTQFTANLVRTAGGVACNYSVIAMFPVVDCTTLNEDKTHTTTPSDVQCTANGVSESDGSVAGESINPDFATKCDPYLLLCVPAKTTIPSEH
jgi:hypothetical protein